MYIISLCLSVTLHLKLAIVNVQDILGRILLAMEMVNRKPGWGIGGNPYKNKYSKTNH